MKGRMVVRALPGEEDCLQIALGPGAKQRCLRRNCETGKPSLTNPWTDRVAEASFHLHSPGPTQLSLTLSPLVLVDYDRQPILPHLQFHVLLGLAHTCWVHDLPVKPPQADLVSSVSVHPWLPVKMAPMALITLQCHYLCPHLLSPPTSELQKGSSLSPMLPILVLTSGFNAAVHPPVVFPISGNGSSVSPVLQVKTRGVILDSIFSLLSAFQAWHRLQGHLDLHHLNQRFSILAAH